MRILRAGPDPEHRKRRCLPLLLLFQKAETGSFELSRIAYADAEPGQNRDGAY